MPSAFESIENVKPFGSLTKGLEGGQQFVANQQIMEGRQFALDQARGRQSALGTYAETKDPTELLKYDPEMVMKLDDAQARKMQAGIDLTMKAAPFLKQMAGDPRVWDNFAKDIVAAGAPKSIASLFTTGDVPTRLRNLDSLMKVGNDLKVDLTKRETDVQLEAAKKKFTDITIPEMKMKAGIDINYLQEAERLKEKYAAVTDQKQMPKTVFDDYTKMVHDVRQGWAKLKVEAEKNLDLSIPLADPKTGRTQDDVDRDKREFRERMAQMETEDINKVRDMYSAPAKKYGVELPAKMELPKPEASEDYTAPSWLSGEAKTSYDNAAARIASMPPGKAKKDALAELKARADKLRNRKPGAM